MGETATLELVVPLVVIFAVAFYPSWDDLVYSLRRRRQRRADERAWARSTLEEAEREYLHLTGRWQP